MKVVAVIPAAGRRTRMAPPGKKGLPSKQFFEINGTPIIIHTLRIFARNRQVTHIVVALRKNEIEPFRKQLEEEGMAEKVQVLQGGDHRQQSVANARSSLKAPPHDILLFPDPFRPFVADDITSNAI